ncbi:MAG: peptide ABC transporter substrate-binding protein [Rhodobacteraceae bacterium]|nr:peptide ABC transporter substrate-binding protein [Paracoccaceae bacterium]
MDWRTDRRGLLRAGGTLFAGLALAPKFAWAADGKTLRLRVSSDFQVLDPKGEIGELDDIIPRCCTVTLTRLSDMRAGNTISPYAAKVYEWKDLTTLAFTLQDGLKWTGDFGPVTVADVKYSFERIAGSDSAWAYQFEKLKEVEVVDEKSGLIHLSAPFKPFDVVAVPYYGGHLVCKAATEKAGGTFTTAFPAQCGPYLFDTWDQNAKITLKRNPDWPLEKPQWDNIEFYIVTDDQAALLAYEAHSFDFTKVAVASSKDLKANPPANTAMIQAASTRYVWLTINMNAPTLKDLRVRQAIQYAYDGDSVIEGAYDGLTTRATGVVQGKFARPANLIGKRDVAKAKALLAEAGVKDLTLQLYCTTDSVAQAIAQIIQASLAEAGITVQIQPTEDAAYWALGDKTKGDGYKSIELVLMNFAGGIDPTENLVWFRPDQIGVYNWSFFDSPEYEDLYQKSLAEQDEAKRTEMFHHMEDLMEQSGAFIFICFEPYLAIGNANLTPVILADGHPDPTRFTAT